MLNVEIKSKKYKQDKHIFDDTSVSIGAGLYVLDGDNGTGKSTLLNMIYRIDTDYIGYISYNETDINDIKLDDYRTNYINYVTQGNNLFPFLSVKESINMFTPDYEASEYENLITGFRLTELLDKKISKLSGGEKQKVNIIIGLLSVAPILIIDEPDNNLDLEAVEFLVGYLATTDRTIILVSHSIENYAGGYNKLYINDMKIIQTESAEAFIHEPNDKSLVLDKRIRKGLTKRTGRQRAMVYLLSMILTAMLIFFSFVYYDSTITARTAVGVSGYCDTCMEVQAPSFNNLIYTYGDKSWLETTPYYFTKEDYSKLLAQPEVKSVTPIGINSSWSGGDIYENDGNFYQIENELDLAKLMYEKYDMSDYQTLGSVTIEPIQLNEPMVVNKNIPAQTITGALINNILYGEIPADSSDEVMLDVYTALYYSQELGLNKISDLVGKQIKIPMVNVDSGEKVSNTFTVSGIYDPIQPIGRGSAHIIFPYVPGSVIDTMAHPWLGIAPEGNPYQYFLSDFNGAYNAVGLPLPTADDITPLVDNAYPGFFIETNSQEDLITLTNKIEVYDKYILIQSNYANENSSNMKYLQSFLIKKTIEIILIFLILLFVLFLTLRLNKREVNLVCEKLAFFGYSREQIKTYVDEQNDYLIKGSLLGLIMVFIVFAFFSNFHTGPMILEGLICLIVFVFTIIFNQIMQIHGG